jgi:hypothetical protein
MVTKIQEGKRPIVIAVKPQDLKGLNTLGEVLGVGHEIGTKVLTHTGPALKAAVRKAVQETVENYNQTREADAKIMTDNIDINVYKVGPGYVVLFDGLRDAQGQEGISAQQGSAFAEEVMRKVLLGEDAAGFKNWVIRGVKEDIAKDAKLLEKNPALAQKAEKALMAKGLHFYAGISPAYSGGAVDREEAKKIAEKLYLQAAQAGKFAQLSEFSSRLPETTQATTRLALERPETVDLGGAAAWIKEIQELLLKEAKGAQQSAVAAFTPGIEDKINQAKWLGPEEEFAFDELMNGYAGHVGDLQKRFYE